MNLPDWRRPSDASILLSLPLACLALGACGTSSGKSAATAATGTTNAAGTTGPGGARFAALRQCLQTNGITLPQRPAGTRRPPAAGAPTGGGLGLGLGGGGGGAGAGGGAGGGLARRLPAGVTQAQFQAALTKCGRGVGPRPNRFATPAAKQALAGFSACMRKQGVSLPQPNTSGTGPVFNATGINTAAPGFKAAAASCQPLLKGVLGRNPAGPGTAPAGQ